MVLLQYLALDIQVYLLSFLSPPDIISIRQTCSQIYAISKLRVVWINACETHILRKGYPFTTRPLQIMTDSDLEQRTCHAYHLASRWLSGITMPRRRLSIEAAAGTHISDIHFIPGFSGKFVLTVSKAIWDVLSIWDTSAGGRKICEWSPRGAIFNGIALNTDPDSEATMAISVSQNDGPRIVQLLSLHFDTGGACSLRTICSISSNMKPIYLHAENLAISNNAVRTEIWNWRAGTSAILQGHQNEETEWQLGRSLQVVYAYHSILVIRDSSILLFPEPELHETPDTYRPFVRHSCSWILSVSATLTPPGSPLSLSILLRDITNDLWSSRPHTLSLYTLQPNPDYNPNCPDPLNPQDKIPYIFPPILVKCLPSFQASLFCHTAVLGPCNTAAWIEPRDRAVRGLVWDGDEELRFETTELTGGHETLVIAAFRGSLVQSGNRDGMWAKVICVNTLNNWRSLAYDEEMGRIALCSAFGKLVVFDI